MNISIGINSFKQEKDLDSREKNCLESIKKVKELSKHNISLYNISFEEEDIKYKDFESLTKLKLSSDIFESSLSRFSFIKKFFNSEDRYLAMESFFLSPPFKALFTSSCIFSAKLI